MRLLDKRALEESVSIKSIEKDAFAGRREKKIEREKNQNAGAMHRSLRSFKSSTPCLESS